MFASIQFERPFSAWVDDIVPPVVHVRTHFETDPGGKFPVAMSALSWAHLPDPTSTNPPTTLDAVTILPLRGVVLTKHLPLDDE